MLGTSLAVQWLLKHRASTAGGMGSIPGQGTKILLYLCSMAKNNFLK